MDSLTGSAEVERLNTLAAKKAAAAEKAKEVK